MKAGAEQAVADINKAGGVLGQKLVLEIGDDACDPKQARSVAEKLASSKVQFVAGHFCSSSSIPASEAYAEGNVLQITPASTNPALTEDAAAKGINTIFRTCGRDDAQGVFAGPWLAKTYPGKNIAILDDKSAYGQGLANETAKNYEASGGKVAVRDTYTAKEKDFSALISKLKDAKIDAVGACVGVRGTRIKNIVDELAGERIDIPKNGDEYDGETLRTRLQERRAAEPNRHNIIVAPEDGVRYADVIAGMDLAIGEGYTEVSLSDGAAL